MKEKKTKKKEERKLDKLSSNFQRPTNFATSVPVIPKFKGVCPNCGQIKSSNETNKANIGKKEHQKKTKETKKIMSSNNTNETNLFPLIPYLPMLVALRA